MDSAPAPALSEYQIFIQDFINTYKELPMLWQMNHPHYRNKAERQEAYATLLEKSRQYYPDSDEDFVRLKIESMRNSFRKERRKVLKSRETTTSLEEVYKPSLWYYDLLLFTVGEEPEKDSVTEEESNLNNGNTVKIPFWSREYSGILINCYRNHPCLYCTSHPHYKNKRRRMEALKKITHKLRIATGKIFTVEDVRRKIGLLRGQFRYEYNKVRKSKDGGDGTKYTPTLWCFEMLEFLTAEYPSKKTQSPGGESQGRDSSKKSSSSSESEDDVDVKKESDCSLSSDSVHIDFKDRMATESEDIFDTIARNLAHKLRDMTEKQRVIADRIIREVMYHGQMESLTSQTRLSLDGK